MKKPCVLMILDGWGYSESKDNNAVYTAKTPNLDSIVLEYPNSFLKCSGLDVGLPKGLMGNSEVGHLNIGAGRIVYQDLTRIDKAIGDGEFFLNKEIIKAYDLAIANNSKIHLMGLLSDGGVHSHINHIEAFLKLAKEKNVQNLVLHPFFDGRDTAPKIGHTYLSRLIEMFKKYGCGTIGSMSGRYYSMDRDKRWERLQRAYDAMVMGVPLSNMDPVEYIKENHKKDIGDEFIEPACFNKEAIIKDGDVVIFFNFRSDRAREITRALMDNELKELNRNVFPKIRHFLCMTEYDANFVLPVAFPKQNLKNIMGEVVSKQGLKQLRIAETEKYAHVTFFFNGGVETPFAGEDRVLVDSPKDVATYDLKPDMSAYKVTEILLSALDKNIYDLVVVNYANCDMVGHTGVFDAAVKAVETVDECSSVIIKKVLEKNGTVFLTADHGNAEKMKDHDQAHTAHTTNDVRFIIIDKHINKDKISLENGRLADIMPSILDWMNIRIPDEVSGKSLIIKR